MLYTLFSPSEGKVSGGSNPPLNDDILFGLSWRQPILDRYNQIANSGDIETLKALFGIKKESDITPYIDELFNAPTMPAIERYDGVAYDYLKFSALENEAQAYLASHTLIFSNLYGVIRAGDPIANYKVKQGNSIGEFAPEKFYAPLLKSRLDELLDGHDILDLRAGYYDKFYKPSTPFTTLKFIKSGKVVSHWAKAYRGIVLRHLATHQVDSIDTFMKLEIDGLAVKEIKQTKLKQEIVYDILG
jgi:cytoplasmic iron level regulating protein YaaA (DUF328/UPF0246 family)